MTEQDQYDGPKGGSIGTMEDGVSMSDKRGREIYLRWPDAIRYARTILLAADVRGLIPAAEAPLTLLQLAENQHMSLRQYHELLEQVRSNHYETPRGDWDGAPDDMYGDDPAG